MPWNYVHSRVKLEFTVDIYNNDNGQLISIENVFNEEWKNGVREIYYDNATWSSIIPELEGILQPSVVFTETGYTVKVLIDGQHPDFMDYDSYIYEIFPTWDIFSTIYEWDDFEYGFALFEHSAEIVADNYQMDGGQRRKTRHRRRRTHSRKTLKNKHRK